VDRKARIREYKENARPAGLFVVRNEVTGRMLVGASVDLPGMLNRQRFQLEMGSHPDARLQSDWNGQQPDDFAFEVLDTLEPSDDPSSDLASDLVVLMQIWIDKLLESGTTLYPMSTRGA